LEEEVKVLFPGHGFQYQKLLEGKFLLSILKDFNFSIATLYLQRNKTKEYISFCDREITMFPDKMGVFNSFVITLLDMKKYDDVLRMLEKFPDKNKENVNYYYYRIYLAQGDMDKAFIHLKKELELYSHRINLVPELIKLNKLNSEETQRYIDQIMEKSDQSIDLNLHVALAFKNTGDYEKAEHYVDKELDLFPENLSAVLVKYELYSRHQLGVLEAGYYKKSWEKFRRFIEINRNNTIQGKIVPLFTALNYFKCDENEIANMAILLKHVTQTLYREELATYLSFRKYIEKIPVQVDVEKYTPHRYLSSYSTGRLAYHLYFEQVQKHKEAEECEKMFELIEIILKYNPGDKAIFHFLEELSIGENRS